MHFLSVNFLCLICTLDDALDCTWFLCPNHFEGHKDLPLSRKPWHKVCVAPKGKGFETYTCTCKWTTEYLSICKLAHVCDISRPINEMPRKQFGVKSQLCAQHKFVEASVNYEYISWLTFNIKHSLPGSDLSCNTMHLSSCINLIS